MILTAKQRKEPTLKEEKHRYRGDERVFAEKKPTKGSVPICSKKADKGLRPHLLVTA